MPTVRHTDDMVHEVRRALVNLGRCAIGDKIVIVAGSRRQRGQDQRAARAPDRRRDRPAIPVMEFVTAFLTRPMRPNSPSVSAMAAE